MKAAPLILLALRQLSLIPRSPTQPMDFADCIEHIEAARERTWPWCLPAPSTSEHNSHLLASTHEPDYSCAPPTKADNHQPPNFPSEIWQLIFEACLPPKADIGGPHPRLRALDAPLILRRVCRQWNAIVLETGPLWSSIHVSISAKEHRDTQDRLEWIKTTLQLPWMSIGGHNPNFRLPISQLTTLALIVQCLSRLYDSSVSVPGAVGTPSALSYQFRCLGNPTQTFGPPAASVYEDGISCGSPPLFSKLRLPTIEALELVLADQVSKPQQFNIPWYQLSHLSLDSDISLTDIWVLLGSCERIVSFKYSGDNILNDVTPPIEGVPPLDQLSSIEIIPRGKINTTSITDILDAPKISVIDLPYIPFCLAFWDVEAIAHLTKLKLSCPLHTKLCRRIISVALSIQEIDLILLPDSEPTNLDIIYAHQLSNITITSTASSLDHFFANLIAKRVRSLAINWDQDQDNTVGAPSLLSFLDEAPGLQKLILTNGTLMEHELLAYTAAVSNSVIHLEIKNMKAKATPEITNLLQSLTRSHTNNLCPMLKTIKLSPCFSQDGVLGAMMESRRPYVRLPRCHAFDLEVIQVGFSSEHQHVEDLRVLAAFSATGGNVVIEII
ncbi:hypothetical protein BD779DRAFT_1472988 [Infundibulicybe gibba]|nr:hypothetical protein BD779DRAFT_1472988 [Infundibulicybe gibba]